MHDTTVEKLGELLNQNPRGLLLMRDELSGLLRTLDKPGREGDREFFLEGWNGTGSYTYDRISRGTTHSGTGWDYPGNFIINVAHKRRGVIRLLVVERRIAFERRQGP